MADCQLCGRPQRADTAYACTPCGDSTKRSLNTAADHWPDLQDSVARLVRHGDPTPRAGKPAPAEPIRPGIGGADHVTGWPSGLVVDLAASEVADAVRNTATTWARTIQDDRGQQPPAGTVELLRWLAGQVGWVRHQPWAADCLDELGDLGRLVVRAVDRPPPRIDAGECGAATETGPCRQRLTSSPGAAIVHCPVCRATWSAVDRRETLLVEARQLRGTATEVAQWLTMLGVYTTGAMVRGLVLRRRVIADPGGRVKVEDVEECRLEQISRERRRKVAA